MKRILVVSIFEGGMQPLVLSTAHAALKPLNDLVEFVDLSQASHPQECYQDYSLIAFSVPMFDSLRASVSEAARMSSLGFKGNFVYFGQYATVAAKELLLQGASAVILGDFEEALRLLVGRHIDGLDYCGIPGVATGDQPAEFQILRKDAKGPFREGLPPLPTYKFPELEKRIGRSLVVGNIETTRGCRFECSYCSVYATWKGKVNLVPFEVVLADVDYLVQGGANHLTVIDADFLGSGARSIELLKEINRSFPKLTFDVTSRADLIAQDIPRLASLVECGVRLITSAFEFPSQRVLDAVSKGFGVDMLSRAVIACKDVDLEINPTWLLFNPWVSFDDYAAFFHFVDCHKLVDAIDELQFLTRLWLYKGSPLLERSDVQSVITSEFEYHYEWSHPDALVEDLYRSMRNASGITEFARCCLKC